MLPSGSQTGIHSFIVIAEYGDCSILYSLRTTVLTLYSKFHSMGREQCPKKLRVGMGPILALVAYGGILYRYTLQALSCPMAFTYTIAGCPAHQGGCPGHLI